MHLQANEKQDSHVYVQVPLQELHRKRSTRDHYWNVDSEEDYRYPCFEPEKVSGV